MSIGFGTDGKERGEGMSIRGWERLSEVDKDRARSLGRWRGRPEELGDEAPQWARDWQQAEPEERVEIAKRIDAATQLKGYSFEECLALLGKAAEAEWYLDPAWEEVWPPMPTERTRMVGFDIYGRVNEAWIWRNPPL